MKTLRTLAVTSLFMFAGCDDEEDPKNQPDSGANPMQHVDAGMTPAPDGTPVMTKCPDPLEPNDTRVMAAELPEADTPNFEICTDDEDWFRFVPDQVDTLYIAGHDSVLAAGDLDNDLLGEDAEPLGYSWINDGMYLKEAGVGPTNVEVFSVLGAPSADPLWLRVYGFEAATNTYGIVSRRLPWRDGADCRTSFESGDCRAQNSSQNLEESLLLPFPVGVSWDPYVGTGVNTLSGLSYPDLSFVPTSRQFARRELAMILRHAIHEVQLAFPGTVSLGVGDIGMPDGTTPDGHPNGTHYEGANMDIAYYIRPDVHREWGNMTYRQICCDAASLEDWSCVDTNQSSAGYGVCVAGSENTHIVDLPRTAMLIAKIAGSGRLRVIGVEAKVKAGLEAALGELQSAGKVTATERNAALARMASKDDHASWLWHFNHLHASFCRRDCQPGKRASTEGPWPDLPLDEQARRAAGYYAHRPLADSQSR